MTGRSWRRPAVNALRSKGVRLKRACAIVGMTPNGYRYEAIPSELNERLQERMRDVALQRPRWGFPRMYIVLRHQFEGINHKRVRRLYRMNSLQITLRKRRRRFVENRVPLPAPVKPNTIWALDFIEDRVNSGRKYRCLNVEDLCTRELLESEVDYSLGGARVTRVLDMLVALRGKAPGVLLTDNGPEFTSRAVLLWCQRNRVGHHFIDPGKPIQNAMMESLNGRMRDECLNGYVMETLDEARNRIAEWKKHYNEERPHSALDNMTPGNYFRKMTDVLTLQSAK